MSIYNNTTTRNGTHFLRPVELIVSARNEYGISSENWTYPTEFKFGQPSDAYYGEVWIDGMDWQPSYWIIEEIQFGQPRVRPLLVFDDHADVDNIHPTVFDEFMQAIFYYRRDITWIKQDETGIYRDMFWSFFHKVKDNLEVKHKKMLRYYISHASQERVEFWININYVPKEYRK